MPPKGWKKDSEGKYPTTSYVKEQENITIQDLLFPKSVIVSLAKEGANSIIGPTSEDQVVAGGDVEEINDDEEVTKIKNKSIMINKDAVLAVQRSATVYVNHLLMFARDVAEKSGRKSCNADDIMEALDGIGFAGFKLIIREKLDEFQSIQTLRKQRKAKLNDQNAKSLEEETSEQVENEHNDDMEVEDKETKKIKIDSSI